MSLYSVFEDALQSSDSLTRVEASIWESLNAASGSNHHGWHSGSLNTVSLQDGSVDRVNSRTVILRAVDMEMRTIDCHTDVRSEKVSDLRTCSCASWTFYDPQSRIQLRLGGHAVVIDDAQADDAWQNTSLSSRAAYLSLATPAKESRDRSPPPTDDRFVSQEESDRGRENFRIVRMTVKTCDWLYLRREGHVRVRASYADPLNPEVCWLVP